MSTGGPGTRYARSGEVNIAYQVVGDGPVEQGMDDVRAVTDAVGSERAAIVGASEGGNTSMLFAATYPERTIALATFGSTAKRIWSPDYPWAPTWERRQEAFAEVERHWTTDMDWSDLAPSLDPAGLAEISRYYGRLREPRRSRCTKCV